MFQKNILPKPYKKGPSMKIYILSRNKELYSTKRLFEEATAKGWEVRVIDYLKCTIEIMKGELVVNYQGKVLPIPDAIIPRIGASRTFYGAAMVRHFEMLDVFSTTGNLALTRSRDKLRSLQVLSKNDVDMPRTVFASNKSNAKDVIELSGGAPLVLKILEGTQGVGVVLVDSEKAAKSVLDAFYGMDVNLLVQEYIEEAGGADIRAFVVNGEVVGAMKRQGAEGDFRSNLHQGGSATAYKLNRKEKATAIAAARAMGLGVCGVDMIPSARGPLVMEVNSSPGLEGIEKSTSINIAAKIMEFIEKSVRPGGPENLQKRKIKKDNIGA
jgi:ribosomal protein S6--L-glutamate ligase